MSKAGDVFENPVTGERGVESVYGTLAADVPAHPPIRIDGAKKDEEVRTITESGYFRQLQERVQALRGRRW